MKTPGAQGELNKAMEKLQTDASSTGETETTTHSTIAEGATNKKSLTTNSFAYSLDEG